MPTASEGHLPTDVNGGRFSIAGEGRVARKEFSVALAQWLPDAVHIVKKQRGFARDFHLRVESSAFKFFRACQQSIA